jgi:hypothetical protein
MLVLPRSHGHSRPSCARCPCDIFCLLHRHNGVVQTVYRAVFGAALIHPGRETRALVPGCTDRPAELLAIVDGLDADHPDIPRHACDVTVRDTVGAYNLSLVRKGLTSPGAGAAGCEERKRKEFIKKVERGAAVAPGWTPDFSFHPMGFDLNGAWGRLHFALSTSRRVSPFRERPSLKLASAAGLSKLYPAISRNGTRRSFEHAAHSRSLMPFERGP